MLGLVTFGCVRPDQGKTVPPAPHFAKASLPPAEPPQPFSTVTPPTYLVPGEQPLVLVFFATWCDLCSYKLDTVKRATSEVGGTDLLLVAVDDDVTKHHVPGFLREHHLSDAKVVDGLAHPDFVERYNPASALPFVLVLGNDGQPLDAQIGLRSGDGQRLEKSLRLALLN